MNKEEIIEFLKENLTLDIDQETEMYSGTKTATVKLKLCNEVIGEGWITLEPGDPMAI